MFRFGVSWGRKRSAIAIAVCVVVVFAMSLAMRFILAHTGQHVWQLDENDLTHIPIGIGIAAMFSAMALIGPAFFKAWQPAFLLSTAIVVLFVFTPFVFLFAVCSLFGICI